MTAKAMSSATGAAGGYVLRSTIGIPAKDADHQDGIMIAFKIPPVIAQHLIALAKGAGLPEDCLMPVDEMHVTLAYLGSTDDPGWMPDEEALESELTKFAQGWPALSGTLNGIGRFMDAPDKDCIYLNFDCPDLPRFRQALVAFLKGADADPLETHGYTPHMTLAYIDKEMPTPTIPLQPVPVTFDSLWESYGEAGDYTIPLSGGKGKKSLTVKIVKSKTDGKYRVLDMTSGVRSPEEGYATREEAIAHAHGEVPVATKSEPDEEVIEEISDAPAETETAVDEVAGEKAHHPRGSEDFNAYFYGEAPEEEAAGKDANPDTYGYVPDKDTPSSWKLPMPDARHVLLAAAAMGPNPPHGNRADIPDADKPTVRSRIRARAAELGLSKEDKAKVAAYLSGKMPSDLSEKDFSLWAKVYDQVMQETGDDVKATLAAQGACNRASMIGSKAVDGLPTSVEGWMMLFTDPENLDLQDTFFDDMTKTFADYYPNAPLWMEHGKNPDYGGDPIGQRTLVKVYPRGIWGEHALHTDHPLYVRTAKDAANGVFAYSSDSLSHYAQQGYDPADGHLGLWPLAGCSLTRTPAEPGLGPVLAAKSLELALKSVMQEREATDTLEEATKAEIREGKMDKEDEKEDQEEQKEDAAKDGLEEVNDANDDFDADEQPESTLHALAQMYGCEPEPTAVRGAMDNHIAAINTEGKAHPDLIKALGMPEDSKAEDVTSHLNNLYSAAMSSEKDDVPTATMSDPAPYNYSVLSRHLSSGGGSKSVGPYMTGSIAQKGINQNTGITKTPLAGVYADLKRIARMERPRFVIGAEKAMSSASGPNGGYILHQEISPVVLDPLRAKVVCYQLGAEHIDMQGTNVLTVPIMNSAPDAQWVGENQAVSDSQPGYRTVTLYPHGVSSLVKVPFNVEANMTPQAESQLRNQMAKSIALKIDKAALLGTGGALVSGGGMEIVGILNTPSAQTYDMGGNGRIPQFTDIGQAFGLLDDANVPYDDGSRRGIALHSQISRAFTLATDTLGNPLLRPAWRAAAEREIMAMPYAISNQIPTNVVEGTSTNSSYVFGGDWQYMYIGLSDQVEVRLDQTFAGNLQAGLLIYVYADVKIVYPQAFFVMKGVLPVSISGVTTGTN